MRECIMALGTFDGVHCGHAALIHAAGATAGQLNIQTAVFTFADHPLEKLTGKKVGLLVTLPQKIELLRREGADFVAVEPFEDVCSLSPEQFMELLISKYRVRGLVCGKDFRFGKGGAGNAEILSELCAKRGIRLQVMSFVKDETGEKISSSRIRGMILRGEMEAAAQALGRPFFVEGQVCHGKGLAHQWGTPTINLPLPEELVLPRFGVYQTRVTVNGKRYDGITNVGNRPTFDDGKVPNVETYILDGNFDQITAAKVEFVRFVREEKKFPDEQSLQIQIAKDIAFVKEMC